MKGFYLTKQEVMERLGYKSPDGFYKFLRRTSDFPKKVKIGGGFNSRIFFRADEVKAWLQTKGAI